MQKLKNKRWITCTTELVKNTPIMDLKRKHCVHSHDKNRRHSFYVIESPAWCNIVPITEDGKIVLVRQFRIGINEETLEIPGGVVDRSDKNPKATAIRELLEETGYAPIKGAKILDLGWTHSNPAIFNNKTYAYAVGPVRKIKPQSLDVGEILRVVEMQIDKIPKLISSEKIAHALILIGFFKLMLESKQGAKALVQSLSALKQIPHRF